MPILDRPVLDRLIGLETEYAMRFRPAEEGANSPSRFRLYRALVAGLKRRVLTAPAKHFKEGIFTANGGAVWFEAERPAAGGGLIEGSTPECRGPRTVLKYQRAQDQLLSECARAADLEGSLSLIKNDRDAQGNVYGAQENYEAILADSWSLWAWRVGLVLLVPPLLLTWLAFGVLIAGILTYLAVAGLLFLPLQLLCREPRKLAFLLFGRDLVEGQETGSPTPAWLETILLWATRVITGPLAFCLLGLAAATAFRRTRRQLLPFLVSRCVLSGAGSLDRDGDYVLADKAPAINCVIGFGGFLKDRPIFTLGHFFKAICAEACFSPLEYLDLFRRRQRLQIGLGDSNMAEVAEYLRVGTTALVLDVIEAGELPPLPPLRNPIRALHAFANDASLTRGAMSSDGSERTALELQRFYLKACLDFLNRRVDVTEEARDIVTRWQEVLDALDEFQATGEVPSWLIGALDWVTKKHLLDEAGTTVTWATRKKIDICYHELSRFGYFQMLQTAGLTGRLVDTEQMERAIRTPPPNSPATMRGHYLREFSADTVELSVNWKKVTIGRGFHAKVIRLARYARRQRSGRKPAVMSDSQKTRRR